MSAVSVKAQRYWEKVGSKAVGAYLRFSSRLYTLAYSHLWDIRDGRKTRILLNNFASSLSPGFAEPIRYVIDVYNSEGVHVVRERIEVVPFAGRSVNVGDLLSGRDSGEFGMVIVHLEQAPGFRRKIAGDSVYLIGTYFFVSWEDKFGNISCSHAIEAYKAHYFNIPRFLRSARPVETWSPEFRHQSNKAILTGDLEELEIFVNNPSAETRETILKVVGADESDFRLRLAPRATKIVRLTRQASWANREYMLLDLDQMPTGNAKPYCFLKYKKNSEWIGFHA